MELALFSPKGEVACVGCAVEAAPKRLGVDAAPDPADPPKTDVGCELLGAPPPKENGDWVVAWELDAIVLLLPSPVATDPPKENADDAPPPAAAPPPPPPKPKVDDELVAAAGACVDPKIGDCAADPRPPPPNVAVAGVF